MKSKKLNTKVSYWHDFIPKSYLSLRKGYSWESFRKDVVAGLTVGIVALPLAMAFAIASGVSPTKGLYTAIVAGFLVSLLGGSYFQIAGPTGAFVVIIYAIIREQGYEGLAIATLMAGVILLIVGFSKLGSLIKYIPYPLVTGFTTGIAFIIFFSQIKDFFGLHIEKIPKHFIEQCVTLFSALPSWSHLTTFVGIGTLFLIIMIRIFIPVLPWGISSIIIATAVCSGFHLPIETIYTRFGEIPSTLPTFTLPDFSHVFSNWYVLIQNAITIAFLAGIESLLSAVVADGMSGRSHKSNCELMAQGVANIGSVLFGGIPATGAIARTAMNIRSHARSPIAGMIHSLTLLFILLVFSPLVSQIPLASLSAVLVVIAWNMSEARHFKHLFTAPAGDIVLLLTTFLLTVTVNIIVAIEVGMIFSAFLFMKRVRDLSGVQALNFIDETTKESEKPDPDSIEKKRIPPGIEVYEITGMFFFGLADSLNSILSNFESPPKVFILRMRKIPVIDASGMHALKEFYFKCHKENSILLLSGVKNSLFKSLKKYGLIDLIGPNHVFSHIDPSLDRAKELLEIKHHEIK